MLDAAVRRVIDPSLNAIGKRLAVWGVGADSLTLAGFGLGLVCVGLVSQGAYLPALVFLLLNRLFDGLDGAVARQTRLTDYGGYLDIVCDFLIWALLPVAFALAEPERALAAAVLLASFMGAAITFLAYAILAAKKGDTTQSQGIKTIYYLEGLTEGTETIVLFVLMMVKPDWFIPLAYLFATMAAITSVTRILAATRNYRR